MTEPTPDRVWTQKKLVEGITKNYQFEVLENIFGEEDISSLRYEKDDDKPFEIECVLRRRLQINHTHRMTQLTDKMENLREEVHLPDENGYGSFEYTYATTFNACLDQCISLSQKNQEDVRKEITEKIIKSIVLRGQQMKTLYGNKLPYECFGKDEDACRMSVYLTAYEDIIRDLDNQL